MALRGPKIKNTIRRFLHGWGSNVVKRELWNEEFATGRWDHIDKTADDCVYSFIEKYARAGNILDLGCGSGNTGSELKASSYRNYTGVDISDVATAKARKRSEECGRATKNRYLESNIFSYIPMRKYEVILFRESIYYVPPMRIRKMLKRYSQYLASDGVFIVRMYDRRKYLSIIETIEKNFHVLEKSRPEGLESIVIVFH